MPQPLDLAVVGNGTIGALVAPNSTVRWMCWPRLDGDPVFCALLDTAPPSRDPSWQLSLLRAKVLKSRRVNSAEMPEAWEETRYSGPVTGN